MNFFVISGAPSTGKTTAINNIAEWIRVRGSITGDSNGNSLPFFFPIQKENMKIFRLL